MNKGSGPEDHQAKASIEDENEDEDKIPLPGGSNMQQRVPGRVQVPSIRLQGYIG
ncbi:hypothetical protein BDV26DRAFT_276432 [Aspergillus bertholletiae]|uniref:Uncharacterized protein n=1 Tax=Aspergillus bertholletiae TaxID=1226010 RepID=A0A5N7AN30_9EURO|nr:hypothetical protein BDV26DRAFT_276432 [Aspergillus bertholletiae]